MGITVISWEEVKPEDGDKYRYYMNNARLGSFGYWLEQRANGFGLYAMHVLRPKNEA